MWLDERQIKPPRPSSDPFNNRFNGSIPCLRTSPDSSGISRFDALDVEGVSISTTLQVIGDRVDVRLKDLLVVHICGVTERAVQMRMLTSMIVQSERGQNKLGDGRYV